MPAKSPNPYCLVEGCNKPTKTKGWCAAHYKRWAKTGDVQAGKPLRGFQTEQCVIEGCDRLPNSRNMCASHYRRWQVYRDVQADIPIGGHDREKLNERIRSTRAARYPSKPKPVKGPKPVRLCSVDGCNNKHKAKGLCEGHYGRWTHSGGIFPEIPLGTPGPFVKKQPRYCAVENCENPLSSKTLCNLHYKRFKLYGDPERKADVARYAPGTLCAVSDCENPVKAKDLCKKHFYRLKRTGTLEEPKRREGPRLNSYGYVIVAATGHPNADVNGRIAEHRLIMSELLGRPLLKGENVHHLDGQRSNNKTDGPLINFRSGNLELWRKFQPYGQRVSDSVDASLSILRLYAPHLLSEDGLTCPPWHID